MLSSSSQQFALLPVRSRIYRFIYYSNSFCSKQDIARNCEISMPTLYQNLTQLMDAGLIRYSGEERSTGGRRAQGLDIIPEARYAAGVSVSEHHLRLVLTDLRLRELFYRSVPFRFRDTVSGNSADLVSLQYTLSEILEEFLHDHRIDRGKLLGVGITIPALITPDHARIHIAPTLNLRNVSLNSLTEGIPYPVYVENDATASGFAEGFVRGGSPNLAYFSLEYGVGGAVLMQGLPYGGDNAQSGEFGHMCLEPGGLPCSCGKSGCMEAYCSPLRIEKTFGVSLEEFFHGVETHVPEYEALLYDMLRHLAIAVNNVHMLLDCDVILGGILAEYLRPYLPVLKDYTLAGNPFRDNADYVKLSAIPRHNAPLGAALHFVQEFVNSI